MRLKLNGRPEIQLPDRTVTRVRSDRVWALLGYLALRRGLWVGREELSLALWPDAPPAVGRHRLRQTLQYCRAVFPISIIEATTHSLRIDSALSLDISEQGPASDFLDGLRDEWIAEVRSTCPAADAWSALVDAAEDEARLDPVLVDLKDLSATEQEEYLKGKLPIWQMKGQLKGPIASLRDLLRIGRLSATGHIALAEMHLTRGEHEEARHLLEASKVTPLNTSLALWHRYLVGVHAHRLGWEAEARRAYSDVVSAAEKVAPALSLQAQYMLGFLPPLHQNATLLAKLAHDGVRRSVQQDDRMRALGFSLLLAIADVRKGDHASAKRRLDDLYNSSSQAARPGQSASLLSRVGRLFQEIGDTDAADRCLKLALSQAREIDNPRVLAEALTFIADRHLEKAEYPDAMLLHLEALALRRQGQGAWAVATSLRGAGVAGLRQNLAHQSRPLLVEALSLYEGFQNDFGIASILFPLAQLSLNQGRPDRARKCAVAALQILDRYPPEVQTLEVPSYYATREDVRTFLDSL